ncbi:MAG: response regulator [Acidobacteria bacterium]|nr:response regulator [Acidobacteriota bacterium]
MPGALTILHIDDDPDTRFLARELLAEAAAARGEKVDIRWLDAPGVEEALAQHQDLHPDAILLDNLLGSEEGVSLVPRLRRIWSCPVWILTGLSPEAIEERCRLCGVAGIIPKNAILQDGAHLLAFLLGQCRPPKN